MSKYGNTEKQQILRTVYEPGSRYRDLLVEDVIEDGRARNFLQRSGIMTLSDLEKVLLGNKKISRGTFTQRREEAVYDSLKKLGVTPKKEGYGRYMFTKLDDVYKDMSVWELSMFVRVYRVIRHLIEKGYRKIGDLGSLREGDIKEIVGYRFMEKFYRIEEYFCSGPEVWLPVIWEEKLKTRPGQIVKMRTEGLNNSQVASKIGLSRQRIGQLILRFYVGQESFLRIIEKKVEEGDDLGSLLPDEQSQKIYLIWKKIKDMRHKQPLPKEEWHGKYFAGYKED